MSLRRACGLLLVFAGWLGGGALFASAEPGALLVLPVQDRTGRPQLAALCERTFLDTLGRSRRIVAGAGIRDLSRAARLRDPRQAAPSALARLAEDVGAGEVVALTLLRAEAGAAPRVSLSALAVRPGEKTISWAGFVSSTGRDSMRALGLGEVKDLDRLAQRAVTDLAGRCLERGRRRAPPLEAEVSSFAPRSRALPAEAVLAVIPFDAITADDASLAAELAGDATLAALWAQGRRVVWPGAVRELMLQRGRLSRGGLDALDRAALRAGLAADALISGTVERLTESGQGASLRPRLAVSLRLIDAEDGSLLAVGGVDADGWSHPGAFRRRVIHGQGRLLRLALDTLVEHVLTAPQGAGR